MCSIRPVMDRLSPQSFAFSVPLEREADQFELSGTYSMRRRAQTQWIQQQNISLVFDGEESASA